MYKASTYEVNTKLILNIQNIGRQELGAAHNTSHFICASQKKNLHH
jgi:hypothetical protein